MSKTLWFTDNSPSMQRGENTAKLTGGASTWQPYQLSEVRGDNTSGTITATFTNPPANRELGTSGSVPIEWISEPLAADYTITGTITCNLWAMESAMTTNASVFITLERIDRDSGALFSVSLLPTYATELGTAASVHNFTTTPQSSLVCRRGDRLRLRVYVVAVGTIGAGVVNFYYDRSTGGVVGDSYIDFTEDLTFEPVGDPGTVIDTGALFCPTGTTISGVTNIEAAQPFVAHGTTLTEVTVSVAKAGTPTDDIVFEVRGDNAGEPSATVIGYVGTIPGAAITTSQTKITMASVSVPLTIGQTYYLVAYRSGAPSSTNTFNVGKSTSSFAPWSPCMIYTTAWAGSSGVWGIVLKTTYVPSTYYLTSATAITGKAASTSRGSSSTSLTISSGAGGWIAPVFSATEWFTPPLEAQSIGGKAKLNIRASVDSVNGGVMGCEIAVVNGDGTGAVVWGRAASINRVVDVTPAERAYAIWVAGDDTAITAGQRLRFRIYLEDESLFALAAGRTFTATYNGATAAAAGDTYVILPAVVSEQDLSTPLAIGKRAAATTVSGVTVVAAGAAPVVIGRKASATVARGVTLSGAGTANLAVGRKAAATTVRGITMVLPPAIVPIGKILPSFVAPAVVSNFNQTDGAPVGWTGPGRIFAYNCTVVGNRLTGNPSGYSASSFNTPIPSSSIDIVVDVPVITWLSISLFSTPTGTTNGYLLYLEGNTLEIDRIDANVSTSLGAVAVPTTFVAGDQLGFRRLADGTLLGYVNHASGGFTPFITRVDATYNVNGYYGGIEFYDMASAVDNFGVGATNQVRGVALIGVGTAGLTIGRKVAATTVRGATLAAVGTVPVTIGKRVAATTTRGVTLVPAPVTVPIGKRVAASPVRGVILTGAGVAPITIGRCAAATTTRGITLVSVGAAPVTIGRSVAVTTVRGITLAGQSAALPIGKVVGGGVLPLLDNFDRTDSASLGANWDPPGFILLSPIVQGNRAKISNVGDETAGVWNVQKQPADQEVSVALMAGDTAAHLYLLLNVGPTTNMVDGYLVDFIFDSVNPNQFTVSIFRRLASSWTGLTPTIGPFTTTSGDVWAVNKVGGVLSLKKNGAVVGSITDLAPLVTTGYPGFGGRGTSIIAIDNFSSGGSGAGGTTVRGVTLVLAAAEVIPVGRVAAATVARGITTVPTGAPTVTVGKRASSSVVGGITLTATGAAPVTVGKRATTTTVRGVAVLAAGTAPLTVGKKVAATTVRGITFVTGLVPLPVGRVVAASTTRGVTLVPTGIVPITVGKRLAATTARGVTLTGAGTVPLTVGKRVVATTVRGTTLVGVGVAPLPIGNRTSATTVRGIILSAQGAPLPVGRRVSTTIVGGITTTPTGTAIVAVGSKASATTVRGAQLVAAGVVGVTIGKKTAATTVRGINVAPAPVVVPIGRRAAATTVRGLSLVPGVAALPIGKRTSATTVRSMVFVATGVAFVPVGKAGVAAIVRGVTLVPGIATFSVGRCVAVVTVYGLVIVEQTTLISERKLYPGKIVIPHRGRTTRIGNTEAIQLAEGKATIAIGDRGDIELGDKD